MQFKDYYETLGVPKTATEAEIKKAFRKLARQHHPDVVKERDKKSAEAKFKEINEAYEVLSDPEKRKKYDTLGADWERGGTQQPPPNWQDFARQGGGRAGGTEFHFGGTGFSDFFETFFGGRGGGRGAGGSPFGGFQAEEYERARGHDIEADIMVTLDEAINGAKRTVSFRREGSDKTETYNVRIPAGVHEGQRIRLSGQGEKAGRGGKAGDLYLRVRFAQHPDFRVEGHDLIHEHEIKPWAAVLGGEVQVPTMKGHARLKIPPGTQSGQRFRMKQQGLHTPAGGRGDLYVVIGIDIPESLSAEQRSHWEALKALG
ncbi:MAG TPA: J domain-containing protein [Chthoniobacteraceae bacterium]|nr:J domain-containing protein [Chthoniobacteraceae bacterium]